MNESAYEKIISYESLYKAHCRARKCKRWKKEVILFEANLSENLWKLHYELKYHKYTVGQYHKFMIYDPKEREIQAISYRDRIVQHTLCDNYLIPLLENRLIYDNCACRKGKGTDFAFKRFRAFMTEYYKKHKTDGYFVKLDVKKYFPSIDHDILLNKLSNLIKDEEIYELVKKIIESYEMSPKKGLPMGNQSSQCFALLYLDTIDRIIKEKIKIRFYLRYMDDMIAIVFTKKEAAVIIEEVSKQLRNEELLMNPKSKAIPVKNGIEFLGWRFFYSYNGKIIQKIKKESKKRMTEHIKISMLLSEKGLIDQDRVEALQASYHGHLSHGNAYFFEQTIKERLFADKSA